MSEAEAEKISWQTNSWSCGIRLDRITMADVKANNPGLFAWANAPSLRRRELRDQAPPSPQAVPPTRAKQVIPPAPPLPKKHEKIIHTPLSAIGSAAV